jgi:serine/threonine protein kinase
MPEKQEPSMDFGPTTQQFDPVQPFDALPAGTRLGGYQILEVLGRGGFGIVYLALDSSLQRQVAIKEYFPAELAMRCDDGQVWIRPGADPASYGAGMKAFLNEAKMLARFDHPSLARVHTFWEENRSAYMVMPYYEGRTLAKVLAKMKAPPDEAWLRSMLAPLLSALSTLHNANCLHLDISPDNILMLGDGRPVLLDFGVASRLATDKTMPLTALLNPAYAPIEQYSESVNLQQGPWSDVYALAGVLHFAIAGVPPARATVRALEDPQRPLAETVAARAEQFPGLGYSATFLAAIDKALAVRPRDRPRGAAEFSLLLDRAAPPEPAAPPPPPRHSAPTPALAPEPLFAAEPMDAPPRPARSRTPVWIASIAVIGLAAAGWTWLQRQPSFANITVSDLPPAIIANVPRPVAEGASAVVPLPTEPTAAGPEMAAPRAACGNRSNFALVYCMQQQCKRWKFNNHPQCIEMERRGEL